MCAPSPKRAPDQIRYGCRNTSFMKYYDCTYKQYRKGEVALRSLRTYIISIISRDYIDYTFDRNTVYDILMSLKQAIAPTDDA